MEVEPLDKEILKQLVSLKKECADEQRRIEQMECQIRQMLPKEQEVTDVVTKGKRGKKPLGSVTITGVGDQSTINRKRAKLRRHKANREIKLAELEDMIADAEALIDTVPDSDIRRLLRFKYIDGIETWYDVAEAMGEGYTAPACRQLHSRFMRG